MVYNVLMRARHFGDPVREPVIRPGERLKMQDQTASKLAATRYQVIAGRFPLLGVVPASTSAQIDQAFAIAREQAVAPDDALTDARDVLKDLSRRLPSELAYPLDSTMDQVSAFYANLSGAISELLPAADNFPALSRANFLALLAAREPAGARLLLRHARGVLLAAHGTDLHDAGPCGR